MEKKPVCKLTQEQIRVIEATVSKGDRVELVPLKDGMIRILRTRREEIKAI